MDYSREALERIAIARAYVVDFHKQPCAPYSADVLYNLAPTPVPEFKHIIGVTPGLVLYFNPERICTDPELSQEEVLGAVLQHEVEHVLRGMWRLEELPNKELANIAADLAINGPLRDEGWKLPTYGVFPDDPEFNFPPNLTLEQYYDLLSQKLEECGSISAMMKGKKGGAGGEDADGEGGEEGEESEDWDPEVCGGACGGIGGNSRDEALEQELDSKDGRTAVEIDSIRRNALNDLETWAAAKGIGNLPGRFQEMLAHRYRKPDVNWVKVLRHTVRLTFGEVRRGGRDYSIRKPSLSSPFLGVVLSGPIDGDPELVFIRDTSGSMRDKELQSANTEIIGAVKKLNIGEFWMIDADVVVHQVKRLTANRVPRVPIMGRGGTDFVEAINHAMKLKPRPTVVIYLTDGAGRAPSAPPPGMAFIWCIVRTESAMRPAPWGKLVVCDKNQQL